MTDAATAVPDALGEEGRIELIVRKVKEMQSDLFELDLVRVANGCEDDDAMPGTDATYGQRRDLLTRGIQNIAQEYPDLWPQVKGYLMGVAAR